MKTNIIFQDFFHNLDDLLHFQARVMYINGVFSLHDSEKIVLTKKKIVISKYKIIDRVLNSLMLKMSSVLNTRVKPTEGTNQFKLRG